MNRKDPQIFFVQINFLIARLDPTVSGAPGHRVGLAWRPTYQHPILVLAKSPRNAFVQLACWNVTQTGLPCLARRLRRLFGKAAEEFTKREFPSEIGIILLGKVVFKLANKASQI